MAKKPTKLPLREGGPNLLMTDSEYAVVRQKASVQGRPISAYVRGLALKHRLESDYSRREIDRVRNAGRRLNRLVHNLHIDPTIVVGAQRRGGIHYDDVTKVLYIIEQVLRDTDQRKWRLTIKQIPRGEGRREYRERVRCTPAERAQIKARAERAGMTQAGFLRAIVFNRPIGKKTFWQMIDQLERIENNLHQLMGVRSWDYVAGQRIHLIMRNLDRRIRELSSGRKRADA